MPPLIQVADAGDPRLADYVGLTDVRLRRSLEGLRQAGFQILALTPAADAVPIDQLLAADKIALLLGTEGDGLSARWLAAADARIRIPMSGGVGSLNVASAAAIACYLLGRRLP